MNGFTRTPGRLEACRLLWLGPMVLGLGFSGWNRAEAAAIHHDAESSSINPASYQTWSEYLMGGPSVWAAVAHPQLNQAIEASMWKSIKSDPPPETSPVVNFFLWKQSLDPARFDHYHPNIAKALAKIKAEMASSPTTTSTSPNDQPQTLTPPSTPSTVPEPATLALAIGMTAYALWWRRR
jgi:hypothetical protein